MNTLIQERPLSNCAVVCLLYQCRKGAKEWVKKDNGVVFRAPATEGIFLYHLVICAYDGSPTGAKNVQQQGGALQIVLESPGTIKRQSVTVYLPV